MKFFEWISGSSREEAKEKKPDPKEKLQSLVRDRDALVGWMQQPDSNTPQDRERLDELNRQIDELTKGLSHPESPDATSRN